MLERQIKRKATYHEIFKRINNAKDKLKKLKIMRDYDSEL